MLQIQRPSLYTEPGPRFNIKMTSYQYRKSHCGDKTILRPSYLHNGISYTGKTISFYWIGALVLDSNNPFAVCNISLLAFSVRSGVLSCPDGLMGQPCAAASLNRYRPLIWIFQGERITTDSILWKPWCGAVFFQYIPIWDTMKCYTAWNEKYFNSCECINNSLRPSDAYMRQWIKHHWFR